MLKSLCVSFHLNESHNKNSIIQNPVVGKPLLMPGQIAKKKDPLKSFLNGAALVFTSLGRVALTNLPHKNAFICMEISIRIHTGMCGLANRIYLFEQRSENIWRIFRLCGAKVE